MVALGLGGELEEHLLQAGAVGGAELGQHEPGVEGDVADGGEVGVAADGALGGDLGGVAGTLERPAE